MFSVACMVDDVRVLGELGSGRWLCRLFLMAPEMML